MQVVNLPGVTARKGTATMEGNIFERFSISCSSFGGAVIMWNSTTIFTATYGIGWKEADLFTNGRNGEIEIEQGIYPNGHNRVEDYIDSFGSIVATSVFKRRVSTATALLINCHFASSRIMQRPFEYRSSEFAKITVIEASSYITLSCVIVLLLSVRLLSFGQVSKLNLFNGLSLHYSKDAKYLGNGEKTNIHATLGIMETKLGAAQRIGNLGGCMPQRRNYNLPMR